VVMRVWPVVRRGGMVHGANARNWASTSSPVINAASTSPTSLTSYIQRNTSEQQPSRTFSIPTIQGSDCLCQSYGANKVHVKWCHGQWVTLRLQLYTFRISLRMTCELYLSSWFCEWFYHKVYTYNDPEKQSIITLWEFTQFCQATFDTNGCLECDSKSLASHLDASCGKPYLK